MAPSWRPVTVVAALIAALVLEVASDDTGVPVEVTVNLATLLREAAGLADRVPGAVGETGKHAAHPIQTISHIADALEPDNFVQISSRQFTCVCQIRFTCSCCVKISLPLLNTTENVCQKLTYNPVNLHTNVNILINGRSFFKANFSGTDSSPMCTPFPPALPIMSLCAHLDNIGFKSGGIQICPSMEIQIFSKRAFLIHFDCIRFGITGLFLGQLHNIGSLIVPNISVPSLPGSSNISIPTFPGSPNISIPTFPGSPNISIPTFPGTPNITVPTVPRTPNISVSIIPGSHNISVPIVPGPPNITVPTVPETPNISVPIIPGRSNITDPTVPETPKISVPIVPGPPNISVPTVPVIPRIPG